MSDDLTPRERRAQRAEKKGPDFSGINWSKAIGPIAVIAVLALVFGMVYVQATKDETCPGHWHSSFRVQVWEERIDFQLPKYVISSEGGVMPLSIHMHGGDNGQQIHWEPRPAECQEFGDFARLTDMELSNGEMVLSGQHEDIGQGYALRDGDVRNNVTGTLAAYIGQGFSDEWQEISISKLMKRQPKDGEKLLIYFGDQSDTATLEALQAQINPPGQYAGDPNAPMHG